MSETRKSNPSTDLESQPKRPRCSATKRNGEPCGSFAVRDGLCAGHAGFGLASSPAAQEQARLAALRSKRERAAQREAERILASRGVTGHMRARAAAERAALVDALFAPLHDPALSATARQAAALKILGRVFGNPGTASEAPDDADVKALTVEELVAAWATTGGEETPPEPA